MDQRGAVIHARHKLGVSERRACEVTGTARSSMRYEGVVRDDDTLRLELISLAKQWLSDDWRAAACCWLAGEP